MALVAGGTGLLEGDLLCKVQSDASAWRIFLDRPGLRDGNIEAIGPGTGHVAVHLPVFGHHNMLRIVRLGITALAALLLWLVAVACAPAAWADSVLLVRTPCQELVQTSDCV